MLRRSKRLDLIIRLILNDEIKIQYEKGVYGAKCINEGGVMGEMLLTFFLPSSYALDGKSTFTLVTLNEPGYRQTRPVSQLSQTAEFRDDSRRLVASTLRRLSEKLKTSQGWKSLSQSPSVVQAPHQKPLGHCAYLMTMAEAGNHLLVEVPILA